MFFYFTSHEGFVLFCFVLEKLARTALINKTIGLKQGVLTFSHDCILVAGLFPLFMHLFVFRNCFILGKVNPEPFPHSFTPQGSLT